MSEAVRHVERSAAEKARALKVKLLNTDAKELTTNGTLFALSPSLVAMSLTMILDLPKAFTRSMIEVLSATRAARLALAGRPVPPWVGAAVLATTPGVAVPSFLARLGWLVTVLIPGALVGNKKTHHTGWGQLNCRNDYC